jgi:hypothetical protein
MAELVYRIAKVTRVDRDDGLKLIPGKWGNGEAGIGDVVELHRPDGIIIIAPIRSIHYPEKEIALVDLASFDLVPVGTEVRVRSTTGRVPGFTVIKRATNEKMEKPQFVQYTFPPGECMWPCFFGKEAAGPVAVWFPMHPLLERVRFDVAKRKNGGPTRRYAPDSAERLEACAASLRRLEEAADGDEERIVWTEEDPDIVGPAAWRQVRRLDFAWLLCPECASEYKPTDLKVNRWRSGGGMAATGGSTLRCPKEHPLLELESWVS